MLAGGELVFRDDAKLVLRLVRERVVKLRFTIDEEQGIAAEAPPLRDEDSFGTALGDVDFRRDGPGFVFRVRRAAFGNADGARKVGERAAPAGEARAKAHIGAFGKRGIKRIDVEFLRFAVERRLQFLQFRGILRREVFRLREVLCNMVELPLEVVRVEDCSGWCPWQFQRLGVGHPAVLIDAAISHQLEVLRRMRRRLLGAVEGLHEAEAFDGLLLHAVDHARLLDACRFENRRHDVDDRAELRADLAGLLDPFGPGDDQAVASAAEVRGDLLGPLKRRVHRVRPADGIVVVGRRPAEIVHNGQQVGNGFLDAVGRDTDFVGHALQRAFAACTVVAHLVNDERVVQLAGLFHGLDDPPDVVIAVSQAGGIDLHHVCVEFLLVRTARFPRRDLLWPGCELRASGHDALRDLSRECFLAKLVPALVELALELGDPFLGRVVRRVAEARRIVGEKRFVRRKAVLLLNPRDSVVGHIGVEVIIFGIMRRFDRLGAIKDGRMPLVGVAANEAVEILEAQCGWPEVERPRLATLPVRHVVVLAKPRCVPAVLLKDFTDRAAVFLHQRIIAGEPRAHFRDNAGMGGVMVASSDKRRAGRRAQRRGVEHVVP